VLRIERAAVAPNCQPADWHTAQQQQHAGSSTTCSSQGNALASSSLQHSRACTSSGCLLPTRQQQEQEPGHASSSGFWAGSLAGAAPGPQAAAHGPGPSAAASTRDSAASVRGLSSGGRSSGGGLPLLEVQAAPASDLSAVVMVMQLCDGGSLQVGMERTPAAAHLRCQLLRRPGGPA
jgi:hypothetical protein